ncbi:hypothetical protein FB107DRAFT_215434 [Schizophyllum commune]
MPPPHNHYFSDLQHEQPSSHSHPATSSSLFNQQASSSISNTASSLSIDYPSSTSHSTSTTIRDPVPSTLPHPAATALITPPSTPTPVGRRKPSISYLPPDSPSHHTRRRSSVVYRPISPSQTSWGLSAQSSGFEPPAKHARRRSQLIHGVASAANSGADGTYVEAGTDAQYATDSRPWWSSEAPVSAPVQGSFQDPLIEPPVDGATRLTATSVAVDPTIAATPATTAATPHLPLHKQHAELLYSIAQEEARCAELRGQLAVREARLAGLKQRWEDRRAERWGDRVQTVDKEAEVGDDDGEREKAKEREGVKDGEEEGAMDRESILEETMRKLEGRKVEIDEGNGDGGEAQAIAATSDNTPASSSSTSPRSSSTSTTPITNPASPASSSTASLSSSSSSFGGIREARRWLRQTLSPSPEMHCRPNQLRPAATPGLNAVRERVVRTASYLHCERVLRLRIWTPSEMTIFAPEEEWIWAWYFVGR